MVLQRACLAARGEDTPRSLNQIAKGKASSLLGGNRESWSGMACVYHLYGFSKGRHALHQRAQLAVLPPPPHPPSPRTPLTPHLPPTSLPQNLDRMVGSQAHERARELEALLGALPPRCLFIGGYCSRVLAREPKAGGMGVSMVRLAGGMPVPCSLASCSLFFTPHVWAGRVIPTYD
jgi:hypothetical protein